jgi:cytochrome b561
MIKNSQSHFGWLSRAIHWVSAILVISLFSVCLWMQSLDYYHDLYRTAPDLHRSFGILLMLLTVTRLIWYRVSAKPKPLSSHSRIERIASAAVHHSLMLLLFVMFISGYLITTAQGDSLYFFNIIGIPSVVNGIANLEDMAGDVHEVVAFCIIGLVLFHVAGALKHHFIDKDKTLKRMLGLDKGA